MDIETKDRLDKLESMMIHIHADINTISEDLREHDRVMDLHINGIDYCDPSAEQHMLMLEQYTPINAEDKERIEGIISYNECMEAEKLMGMTFDELETMLDEDEPMIKEIEKELESKGIKT